MKKVKNPTSGNELRNHLRCKGLCVVYNLYKSLNCVFGRLCCYGAAGFGGEKNISKNIDTSLSINHL